MNARALAARLLPPPRSVAERAGAWTPPPGRALAALLVEERDPRLGREAYRLEVTPAGPRLAAADELGLRQGRRTFAQLVALARRDDEAAPLPALAIEDSPSFAERGVMLDVARDRRPTLATLFALVERLAALKVNRLQLYMEADFAYSFASEVTAGRSPYTPDELRALDACCAAHGIELVPNQQSFGHLHRWLVHPAWAHLAEVPEGVEHAFARVDEPFSLAPTHPEALPFLARLYDELLPCFSSDTVNVGLDETFDLGQGRSRDACAARGKHRVYLDFLAGVHALLAERGKRMQFWGDIVVARPEDCGALPADVVALDWGYEAQHPFDEELAAFARAGREVQVCPGTSAWNGFVGRTRNLVGNLTSAARLGARHGATGLLVTDWGDRGHLQPWPISAPGLVLAAALAWNADAADEVDEARLAAWLDAWWFEDDAGVLGARTLELGRLQEVMGERCRNGNAVFFLALFDAHGLDHERLAGLDAAGLERGAAHLDAALDGLDGARSRRADAALLAEELRRARDLARYGVAVGRARLAADGAPVAALPARTRAELRARLDALAERHAAGWAARFRPGGLERSLSWLTHARAALDGV